MRLLLKMGGMSSCADVAEGKDEGNVGLTLISGFGWAGDLVAYQVNGSGVSILLGLGPWSRSKNNRNIKMFPIE